MSDFFLKGGVYQPWIFHLDMVVTITSHDSRWRPYKKNKTNCNEIYLFVKCKYRRIKGRRKKKILFLYLELWNCHAL